MNLNVIMETYGIPEGYVVEHAEKITQHISRLNLERITAHRDYLSARIIREETGYDMGVDKLVAQYALTFIDTITKTSSVADLQIYKNIVTEKRQQLKAAVKITPTTTEPAEKSSVSLFSIMTLSLVLWLVYIAWGGKSETLEYVAETKVAEQAQQQKIQAQAQLAAIPDTWRAKAKKDIIYSYQQALKINRISDKQLQRFASWFHAGIVAGIEFVQTCTDMQSCQSGYDMTLDKIDEISEIAIKYRNQR